MLYEVITVDIDAHHGDGMFYGFEDDPDLIFADIHEDGRFLYPGTGHADETGTGRARGTKLNIPVAPGSDDAEFRRAWERVEAYLEAAEPVITSYSIHYTKLYERTVPPVSWRS